MTVTVGFATAGEPLDERGAQAVGEDLELGDQKSVCAWRKARVDLRAVGRKSVPYIGQGYKNGGGMSKKKKNALEMRKVPNLRQAREVRF